MTPRALTLVTFGISIAAFFASMAAHSTTGVLVSAAAVITCWILADV